MADREAVRRSLSVHPGDLLRVDVKEPGHVTDGGGWRCVGHARGRRNKQTTPSRVTNLCDQCTVSPPPGIGWPSKFTLPPVGW